MEDFFEDLYETENEEEEEEPSFSLQDFKKWLSKERKKKKTKEQDAS